MSQLRSVRAIRAPHRHRIVFNGIASPVYDQPGLFRMDNGGDDISGQMWGMTGGWPCYVLRVWAPLAASDKGSLYQASTHKPNAGVVVARNRG